MVSTIRAANTTLHGNFSDWWTADDAREFEKRADCTANEYSGFVSVKDDKGEVKLNGKLTLGENTADNGGLKLAYMALTRHDRQHAREADRRLYTGPALFPFLCSDLVPERYRSGGPEARPHRSPFPGRWRANGAVQNSAAFQEAFGCKAGQPMVAENACRVW